MYISSRSGAFELSTEYSIDTEEEREAEKAFNYYQKYSWLKDKLWQHYETIGNESMKYAGAAGTIRHEIADKTNKVSDKVSYFKREFHNLKR